MTTTDETPPPFRTYFRMVRQEKRVAEVTAENIGQIAALIGGSVDYSTGQPVLVSPDASAPWRIRLGSEVGLLRDGHSIQNEGGFNRAGDWTPIADEEVSR